MGPCRYLSLRFPLNKSFPFSYGFNYFHYYCKEIIHPFSSPGFEIHLLFHSTFSSCVVGKELTQLLSPPCKGEDKMIRVSRNPCFLLPCPFLFSFLPATTPPHSFLPTFTEPSQSACSARWSWWRGETFP